MTSWYGITDAISNMAFANFNQSEHTKKENLPIISGVLLDALHCTHYHNFFIASHSWNTARNLQLRFVQLPNY